MEKSKPLYRKENTRTHGTRHRSGKDYSEERSRHKDVANPVPREGMHGRQRRGLDYTPLFKFLLSRVGGDWDEIFSEAKSRLDVADPIFWIVARAEEERKNLVRIGQATFYSGLYVDKDNKLQKVDPELRNEDLRPDCACCTHTFNGEVFINKY